MKKIALLTFALLAPALARAGFSTDNLVVTGSLLLPHGSTTPASQCTSNADRGKIFVDTAAPSGQQIYECEGTGGWKLQGGTGGGSSPVAIDTGTVNQLPLNRLAAGTLPSNVVPSTIAVATVGLTQLNLGGTSATVLRGDGVLDNGVRDANTSSVGDSIAWDLKSRHTAFGNPDDRTIARISGEITGANGGSGSFFGDTQIWASENNGPTLVPVERFVADASTGSLGSANMDQVFLGRGSFSDGTNHTHNFQESYRADGSTGSFIYGTLYGIDRIHYDKKLEASSFLGSGASLTGMTSTQVGLGNVQNVDQTIASNLTSGLIPNARQDSSSVTLRGQTPLVVSTNGVVVGNVNTLNLKPGTNVTMTAAMYVSSCDVTVNSTASGGTPQDFNLADGTGTLSGSKVSGGTFGAVDGSALTNLTAANIAGGALGNTVRVSSLTAVVTAGSYGSATISPTITFNAQGQVIAASSNTIAISGSNVSGGTFGAVNGSALTNLSGANVGSGVPAANIAGGVLGNTVQVSSLAAVTTAGSYGSATISPTITFNAQGQVTSASSNTISISGSNVSGGTFGAVNGSALTNLTAANISAGSLGPSVLVSSLAAVATAGSYGSTTIIPTITINAQGQVIALSSNTAAAGAAGPFTNAVSSTNLSMGGFSLNMGTAPVLNVTSMSVAGTYNASNVPWSFVPYFYARVGNPDQSFVAANSTVTPNGFTFWAPANSTITGHVQLQLNSSSSNSGGFRFHMTGPANPVVFELRGGGAVGSATAFNKASVTTAFSVDTAISLCTFTSGVCEETFDYGIVTGATAGTVTFNVLAVGVLSGNNFIEHESWMDAHLQ